MEIIPVADSDIQSAQLTKLNRINFEECLESLRNWISKAWTFWVIQDYGNSSSLLHNILQQISFGHRALFRICWLISLWKSKNFFVVELFNKNKTFNIFSSKPGEPKRSSTKESIIAFVEDLKLNSHNNLNKNWFSSTKLKSTIVFFISVYNLSHHSNTIALSFLFLWSTYRALIS